jgi:hypothetical protein
MFKRKHPACVLCSLLYAFISKVLKAYVHCCGSGMIFFGSVSGSDFSDSFGSDPGSGSDPV